MVGLAVSLPAEWAQFLKNLADDYGINLRRHQSTVWGVKFYPTNQPKKRAHKPYSCGRPR